MTEPAPTKPGTPSLTVYGVVGVVLGLFVALLIWITSQPALPAVPPRALLSPIFTLVALTAAAERR